MNTPEPRSLSDCRFDTLPYFVVGDEIFPFKTWLGSTHKVQVNPGRSLFDWAMKPFALRRLGHHIVCCYLQSQLIQIYSVDWTDIYDTHNIEHRTEPVSH